MDELPHWQRSEELEELEEFKQLKAVCSLVAVCNDNPVRCASIQDPYPMYCV
jgi:hypothetical protein